MTRGLRRDFTGRTLSGSRGFPAPEGCLSRSLALLLCKLVLSLGGCDAAREADADTTRLPHGEGGAAHMPDDAAPSSPLQDAAPSAIEEGGAWAAMGDAAPENGGDGGAVQVITELDPELEHGVGPSGCPDEICGADRSELPRGPADHRLSPVTVVPEPPRIERILRHAELANAACLSDCPPTVGPDHACSNDCQGRVVQPSLPAHRTTTDGRLALTGGGRPAVSASRLDGLNVSPLVRAGIDLHERAFSREMNVDVSEARAPQGVIARGSSPNRFFCAEDQAAHRCAEDDCYDLTLIEEWQAEGAECPNGWALCARLAAVPIRIRVQNPKTASAVVVEARATGDWTASQSYPAHTAEPIATADGRLVVFRLLGGYPLSNGIGMDYAFMKNDGSIQHGRYSLSYVYSETPCDVKAWFSTDTKGAYSNLRPWSAAHYDGRLVRYGFAAYPLRDAYGRPFQEGELVRGSYPWMDRHGNNVFFSTILPVGSDDGESPATRYPMSVEHPRLGRPTGRTPTGFAVAGSWTHGKIVMLDGVLNNEDYSIDPGDTRRFELYRTASGAPISVRVDGNSNTRAFPTPNTRGNSQHMESLENTYAMHRGMRAVTPRDVVWTLGRGDALQEVVFDDLIDPHVLLFAPMNAAFRMPRELSDTERAFGTRRGHYQDGFDYVNGAYVHEPAKIELQNAATSPQYAVATHGTLSGDARVEPVAQGGIEGRGLWLEPGTTARFDFPGDKRLPTRSFYVSVFFDARAPLGGGRRLLTVEGEHGLSYVVVHPGGISVHRKIGEGAEVASFPVSSEHPFRNDGWHHVGVLFGADGFVTALVDGDPIGARQMAEPLQLGAGVRVSVGGTGYGFAGARGWVDEVRLVVAGEISQLEGAESIELLCNYARGTMGSLGPASSHFAGAERSPLVRARAESLGLSIADGRRLRCVTDYSADLAVRIPLPDGALSLRTHILEELAGEATLHAGMPRPDTTRHGFCRTCHAEAESDPHRPEGLGLAALRASKTPVELDPRTQPGQPFSRWDQTALIQGVVPAQWFKSIHGIPVPAERQLLDQPRPILDWWLSE